MYHLINREGNVHRMVKDAATRDRLIAQGFRVEEQAEKKPKTKKVGEGK